MSRTNHPVYQVLVTKAGVNPLATANKTVAELAPGQIGIFNYESNLSIDVADASTMRRVYFAVGLDKNLDGITDDVIKSSGEYIETHRIHHLDVKCPVDCVEQIVQVQPQGVKGSTEYVLKIQFQNEELATLYGKNLPTKSFYAKTGCCESEAVCSCTDNTICSKVALDLVNAINLDDEHIISAVLYDTTNGVIVDVEEYDTWIEDSANADACLAIRIIGNCGVMENYCTVNYGYHKLRAFNMTVSFYSPQSINMSMGTITEIQELVYPQGSWYDLKQWEYEAGGWNGKPGVYRTLELADRTMPGFDYNIIPGQRYIVLTLGYDSISTVGFQEPINDMETLICVPCVDDIENTGYSSWTQLETLLLKANFVLEPLDNECCNSDESDSSSGS